MALELNPHSPNFLTRPTFVTEAIETMLCEGKTRNRWRDGQVCPDVDKELWRLGPHGSGVFWRVTRKSDEGGERRKKVGRRGRVESGRENGRKEKRERTEGVRNWSEKDDERRWR
ncbi:hypothetical protein TNCV_1248471 [Trichonephila clavipes]|nr:hypothetical protein TNCV_1248471 [Trichonephila clavipes]